MRFHPILFAIGLIGALGAFGVASSPASARNFVMKKTESPSQKRLKKRLEAQSNESSNRGIRAVKKMTPTALRQSLMRRGYRDVSAPKYRPSHNVYLVSVETVRDRRLRLTVDASNGRVTRVVRLRRSIRSGSYDYKRIYNNDEATN